MAPHQNWLGEMVLTRRHNICFNVEMRPVSSDPIEANISLKNKLLTDKQHFFYGPAP